MSLAMLTPSTPAKSNHEHTSECLRCGGLLVVIMVRRLRMYRCVQCGDRFDATVLKNRQLSKPMHRYSAKEVADLLFAQLIKRVGMVK